MGALTDLLVRWDPPEVMRTSGMQPDPWQAGLLTQQPHRALVVTSRQAGKSVTSAALALHRALSAPRRVIVAIAPSQRQSSLLVSKVRSLAEHLGLGLLRNAVMSIQLANESIVHGLPGSSDTVRGYSPNLLIIDEACYTDDALYTASLPMLAATQGDLIAISTPNGQQGWFWHEWNGDGAGGWSRIEVPYTDISRITSEFIAGQKASMSRERFSAEYECAFNATTHSLFPGADIASTTQDSPVGADVAMPGREVLTRRRARAEASA